MTTTSTVDIDAPIPYVPPLTAVPAAPDTTSEAPALLDVVAVIEEETNGDIRHDVQLTLTDVQWRMLVGDIAARILHLRANGRPVLGKLLAAGSRPCGIVQQNALTDLVTMLSGVTYPGSAHTLPPQWDLAPEDAGHLVQMLTEALEEPVVCACGAVVHQPSQLTGTCGGCVDLMGGDR
jgi:hypothetical protein